MRNIYKVLFTTFLLSIYTHCSAKEVLVRYLNTPLSEILIHIRDEDNLAISFNQRELTKFKITIDTVFSDGLNAVNYLIRNLPLKVTLIDDVVVIFRIPEYSPLNGMISDSENGERLPYASISYNRKIYLSDAEGLFRIPKADTGAVDIFVSYLGYRALDTVVRSGLFNIVILNPVHIDLKEVLVEGYETGQAMQTGESPGVVRINHRIAQYLPGNGDNSVFNLLRMMPGIRATGEPAGLSVWGSEPGESSVIFDGYRLFSMNGFNEQISSINPFMVKEIRVLKGGYGPSYGNQIGAVAEITGVDGKRSEHDIKLNLNNLTANMFVSIPTGERATVSAAYRQTYYGLYDVNTLNPYGKRVGNQQDNPNRERNQDLYIIPQYYFRDANFKLSGELSESDNYFVSLYGAADNFEYSLNREDISLNAFEKNIQFSAGAGYNKIWSNNSLTRLFLKYSHLDNSSEKVLSLNRNNYYTIKTDNLVSEAGASVVHSISLFGKDEAEIGLGAEITKDINDSVAQDEMKLNLYCQDRIIMNNFSLTLGARADFFTNKIFIQPRLSMKYRFSQKLSTSLSWGIYNQFLGKVPVIYENKISSLVWKILGDNEFPVMGSMHSVFNITYTSNKWLVSLEGYNKKNWDLSRIYSIANRNSIVNGESLISGLDLFTKWERRGSQVFASFSVANAEERFLVESNQSIHSTPLELKIGTLWNLSPVYLSAEYVYGEGFSEFFRTGRYSNTGGVYNRLDVAATYSFKLRGVICKAGLSILNLLNSPNVKTLDILPSANGGSQTAFQNLYTESIPFTPTIFVQIAF